ncbi:MAG TPA: hypothetical protein VKV16_12095, partial [Solirubrobacteraceae bacterium]|nr:hypothetical protein [Solirubrobacteraceae bacterium]
MSVSRESADRGRGGGEGDGDKSEDGSARGDHPARIGWRPSRIACVALLLGLAVTAGLALTAHILYDHNEHRLLKLRARELALVLAATAPTVQTPLASAAELANATAGDTRKFRAFIAPDVGAGRSFSSVSLWSLHGARARPLAVVGATPGLASKPGGARLLRMLARRPGALNLTSMLAAARPAIGFEYNASTAGHGYAVYAENPLPANRRSSLESNNAFSDLDYVLYLGRSHRTSDLLVTSEKTLPLRGLQAAETVPFGSGVFTLVVAPRVTLSGAFFESLPWIVAGAGVLLTLAAAAATERLARGRERAERLARQLDHVAAENEAMYEEQRSISQTLQHALLPDTLPQVRGLSVSALYVPAPSGGDVGGDWYDVVVLD